MLNVTTLLGRPSGSDWLRYGRHGRSARSAGERAPVVVWNCTRRCNLACRHCYSDSDARRHPEMTGAEARRMIRDVAELGAPALLLSGGEPLVRRDALELIAEARGHGLPVTLSTNGTLVGPPVAAALADLGVRYVGVSLDGLGAEHDAFRGRRGAFRRAMAGIRALRVAGVRAGVRITLSESAMRSLPDLLALVEEEGIARVCFYHLVPAGRGASAGTPDPARVRGALDTIFTRAKRWVEDDRDVEVLTVDNYADGPALRLWMEEHAPERVAGTETALAWNGGGANAAGVGLAAVDWEGRVRPDQFWPGAPLGNVRERPLSEIWSDPPPLLAALRGRREALRGRCAGCRFRDVCGGGLASRALATTGDLLASDPGCHLSEAEIGGPA